MCLPSIVEGPRKTMVSRSSKSFPVKVTKGRSVSRNRGGCPTPGATLGEYDYSQQLTGSLCPAWNASLRVCDSETQPSADEWLSGLIGLALFAFGSRDCVRRNITELRVRTCWQHTLSSGKDVWRNGGVCPHTKECAVGSRSTSTF